MIRRFLQIILAATTLGLLLSCPGDNNIGKTYTITYYSYNHTSGTAPDPQTKEYGVDISIAGNTGSLIKGSEILISWSTAIDGRGTAYPPGAIYSSNADLSLYPVWGKGYIISYLSNNATAGTVPDIQLKPDGVNINISTNSGSLSKTGYGFAGWNTEPDGSGTKYSTGEVYSNNENINLHAMWYDSYWARTIFSGTDESEFLDAAVDSSGNIYTVGYQMNAGLFSYDTVDLQGTFAGGLNAVLIKYNSDGSASWGTTPVTSPNASVYNSVTVDDSDNIYVCGYIAGTSEFDFGGGQTATGLNLGQNALIVKYDSNGNAVWARTVKTSNGASELKGISTDGSSIYIAGYQTGQNFTYSDGGAGGVDVAGSSLGNNAVLLKYSSGGTPEWAVTSSNGTDPTWFLDTAVSSAGYIYAVGQKNGTANNEINGLSCAGISAINSLIVQIDPAGIVKWVRTPTNLGDSADTLFWGITTDNSNNAYVVGHQDGSATINYDIDTSATTSGVETGLIVRYSSNGAADWTRVPDSAPATHRFNGISCNGSALYIAGSQNSNMDFIYGSNIILAGTSSAENSMILKFGLDGKDIWGKSLGGTIMDGSFNNTIAATDYIVTLGYQNKDNYYLYGTDVSGNEVEAASGSNIGKNSAIVKYIK